MLRMLNIETDLDKLVILEQKTQISPWTMEVFQRCVDAGSYSWVIEVENNVIGFIFVLLQAGEAHILNVCVQPEYQNKGYGFQLLTEALSQLKEKKVDMAYLEVRRSNAKAMALYRKMGFALIGERKNYYVQGEHKEDALVFAKDLRKG